MGGVGAKDTSISDGMNEVQGKLGPVCSKLRRRFDPAFLAVALLEQAAITLMDDGVMNREQAMRALVNLAKPKRADGTG